MLSWEVQLFPMSLRVTFSIISLSLLLQVQAQQNFSSNPDDYDLGWLVAGTPPPGQVPGCAFRFNAFDYTPQVVIYGCDDLHNNEVWAYQNSTGSIILLSYLSPGEVLCLDASLWNSSKTMSLSPCNSSAVSQSWTWEGNRLRTGLTDNGSSMYLWGMIINQGITFGGQYAYGYLVAASSEPEAIQFASWTSSFTFLSPKKWVDNPDNVQDSMLNTEGLLQIANLPPGQIANGGFENSTMTLIGSSIIQTDTPPSYFPLCGWIVNRRIDYVKAGYLPPANGSYSIHLSKDPSQNFTGMISQTFQTESGKEYSLSFYFTGFPPTAINSFSETCGASYNEARLQVQVTNATTTETLVGLWNDGTLEQNFTTSVIALTSENMGWKQETIIFTASTNVTTIFFNSLNFNDSCGPMIDTVELSPTTITPVRRNSTVVLGVAGSIGGLVGLIALLTVVYGICYYTAPQDYSGLYKTQYARVYSERELSNATRNFNTIVGEGGFGTVYKAEFPNGILGAVKVEKPKGPNSSSKVFASDEITVLLRVHHRNLVNLIGFCIGRGRRHMLVFEYLPNGTLYDRLHQCILPVPPMTSMDSIELRRLRSVVMPWKQRMRIAVDVACGLEYLHHEADPPIVHRDVKSQNILLTITDSAKLADFGLSKAAPVNATSFQSIETMVRGSLGYLDPQYLSTGIFSPKCDVYSFGVVLLELISGHQAIYNAASLASWAVPYMTSPSLYNGMVDEKLNGEFDAKELETLVDLSRMCIQEDGKMRPNMRQVVAFLNSRLFSNIGENVSGILMEQKVPIKGDLLQEDESNSSSDSFGVTAFLTTQSS